MIECRTRGLNMRADVRVDADGFHCFALDETQHDPFNVLQRLIDACGVREPTDAEKREREQTWVKIMRVLRVQAKA
jgi:hypothetical protein